MLNFFHMFMYSLQGCQTGVVQFFRDNLIAAGGIGIAFGLLEVSPKFAEGL